MGTGSSPSAGFDANNRIVSGIGVAYDAAGDTTNDGSTTYTYDAEGRIITAVNGTSGTSTYVYDAEGRRIRKTTVAGGTVDFVYDLAGHQVAQISSTGTWTRAEVYAGGRHLATYSGGTGGTTYFIHADWLGTERARSNVTANPYGACTSLPFGDWLVCAGGDPSPMHFTGKEHDNETGLENFGARYDASSLGRFMSPDPIGIMKQKLRDPQQWNMYSYARNNPLRWLDPTGMYVCSGTREQCKAEQNIIQKDLKSKDSKVRAAAKAYGPLSKKAGDKGDNGVTVKFGEQGHGGETQFTHDKTGVVVTMNSDVVVNGANATKNSDNDVQARTAVAHEGEHVKDYKADIANNFDADHDISMRQSEHNAYGVTNAVLQESGRALKGGDFSTPEGIDQFLRDTEGEMNLDVPISTNTEQ